MNTKTQSIFKALPKEAQQRILDLCASHTYDEAVEIIARPEPEGLQLKTSSSALCRFFCAHNAEARKAALTEQAATSFQFIRQRGAGSLRTAILSLLENRIFEALRSGKSVMELKEDFATLKDFQKGFLAEEKWRQTPGVDAAKELSTHLSSDDQHYDFVPCDQNGEPVDAPPLSEAEIDRLNQTEGITPEAIIRFDQDILLSGACSAKKTATAQGFPAKLIVQRIDAYYEHLDARGITPVQAAIEARRARLRGEPLSTPPLPEDPAPVERCKTYSEFVQEALQSMGQMPSARRTPRPNSTKKHP